MGAFIYQWIDLLWLPIAWFSVHKHHRLKAMAFVLTCVFILRTQVELVDTIGYSAGFLPFWDTPALTRGLIVYSIVIAVFLLLAHYSPRTKNIIFFAASLTMFFFAFIASMLIMLI